MKQWRGFIVESYHFVSPRGFKEWFRFIVGFPRAMFIYNKENVKHWLRVKTRK